MELLITDQLKDKIVYLPADSDESEIYKYLNENKEKYGYKELIHTSDDFRTHEDLFEYCDIVLTNPPFSLTSELMEIIDILNKDYFLYNYPMKYLAMTIFRKHYIEGKLKLASTPYIKEFKRPDGEIHFADTYIFTTLIKRNMFFDKEGTLRKFELTKKIEDLTNIEYTPAGYLNIDKIRDLPCDYKGIITCTPIMVPFYEADGLIEIATDKIKRQSGSFRRLADAEFTLVNGKQKFIRVPIRIKNTQ